MHNETPGNEPSDWLRPVHAGPLSAGEVHVWLASVETLPERYEILGAVLSDEEIRRAERFRFEQDRRRYVTARAVLRKLISGYLNIEAGAVSIVSGRHGKPELSPQSSTAAIRFNVSHSRGLVLLAFTLEADIGVDIEYIRSQIDLQGIARRFFSVDEETLLRELPPNLREKAFFECWTRKEAFIKAVGKGLSFGLDRVEVCVDPATPASLLNIGGDEGAAALWTLRDLPVPQGYVSAFAVKATGIDLHLRRWCFEDYVTSMSKLPSQ